MKKSDFEKYGNAFLHWKGWRVCVVFWGKFWKQISSWTGWRKLFGLPFPALLGMSVACGAGLVWVFTRGLELQLPAYFLYALSAYCLTAVCVQLPAAIRGGKQWLARHPKLGNFLRNEDMKFKQGLYVEQFLNFAYGIFKTASGLIYGSAWIGADGIYNLAQAVIQLFQILRRKKLGDLERQWRSYRSCGMLILLMHLTLTGIVFQMINWNRAQEQGQIMVIATAAFAFYKFINSFLDLARDRKHTRPVDSSVRMLNLAQAIFAIFSLQASMIHAFGSGESWEHLLNTLTGCAVCLLIITMGFYMIRRANREIRKLQEANDGE